MHSFCITVEKKYLRQAHFKNSSFGLDVNDIIL